MLIQRVGRLFAVIGLILCCVAAVKAGEASDLVQQLADLKTKVAALEAAMAAPLKQEEPARLSSVGEAARLRVSGAVTVDTLWVHREDLGRTTGDRDSVQSTRMGSGHGADYSGGTRLTFDLKATPSTGAIITLDLDSNPNGGAGDQVILEEAYFIWRNVHRSDWALALGQKDVEYGLNRMHGITDSFHNGNAVWFEGTEEGAISGDLNNPYETVGTNTLPTAPKRVVQASAAYTWRDFVRAYATVFQNDSSMDEDRSSDNGIQSFALKVELAPMERLMVSLSFLHQHSGRRGNPDLFGSGIASDYQSAISVGAEYEFASLPVEVWAEYQHGFKTGYVETAQSDVLGVGVLWHVDHAIDLSGMAEWAQVQDSMQWRSDGSRVGWNEEELFQFAINGRYTFENQMYIMLEYSYQLFHGDVGHNTGMRASDEDARVEREAHMIGLRTGFEF